MLILQASDKRASKLKLKMQEGESDKAEVGEEDEEDSDMEPGVWDEDTLKMLIELSKKPRPPRRKCPFLNDKEEEERQAQTFITDDILLRVSQLFEKEEAANDFFDWTRQAQEAYVRQKEQEEQAEREYTRRLSIKALEDQMQFERWCTCLDYV